MAAVLQGVWSPQELKCCVWKSADRITQHLGQALQLLEYLIKNGSERVVDNARDHIYELKALRNFHYIDDKGKDQGINGKVEILLQLVI